MYATIHSWHQTPHALCVDDLAINTLVRPIGLWWLGLRLHPACLMANQPMIDEDELVEITTFGDPCPQYLRHGLDMAEAWARQRYIDGAIEAEDLEAELERLWRKRERLDAQG